LEIIRAVKIHNSSIRQAALDFNMNYRALRCYYKKWICDYQWFNFETCDNQTNKL